MSQSPKHILVIRFSAMGDVAMTIPVLSALVRQYPKVRITVLTRPFFTPFFRDLENVTVYNADLKGEHKGFSGLYRLSIELRKLNVDFVADLHNVLRSSILKFFLFGKVFVQINKGRSEKKALIKGEVFKQLKTTHQRYADVFERLGFKLDLTNPDFPGSAVLNENLNRLIGDKSGKWIGIAPFAKHKSKMYPLKLMEKVIVNLSKSHRIFLFGGGGKEIELLQSFEDSIDGVVNLAGKLTLDEELDIISNLDVMLSMDSGNAHIGAMLGIPVVTIWGVTHPYAGFYPFSQDPKNALLAVREQYPKIPTSIYGNIYPKKYINAAGSVPTSEIIDKVMSCLK